jgi:hypothetical protein
MDLKVSEVVTQSDVLLTSVRALDKVTCSDDVTTIQVRIFAFSLCSCCC